jgi:chloramphenicol-sensitive protein RarD
MNAGLWYGLAAYGLWGLFPLYWKLFGRVPALEVLAHRISWSFVVLAVLVAGLQRSGLRTLRTVSLRVAILYGAAAVLIGVNWFLYVWAVNAGFVVETSLGYYVTPLVNVLLGVLVFRETLRPAQWVAVGLAAAGVLHLTTAYGSVPWVAAGLAVTFGAYGLVKKKAPLPSLEGLTLETMLLVAPAAAYLGLLHRQETGAFLREGPFISLLLAGGGLITIVPLLLFASALRRIPLSVMGVLQYISPTIQLLIGVLVFREPFSRTQAAGFAFVWLALIVFAVDGLRRR